VQANWENAGLLSVGGIPDRTTVCATVSPSGKTPPSSGDDAANINAAIASCGSGDVVQLASGTFELDMSEKINLGYSNVTLRGTGTCNNSSSPFCSTVINIYNGLIPWTGGKCGVSTSLEVACGSSPAISVEPAAMADEFDWGWSSCGGLSQAISCGAAELDADASQGQTTIQVNSTAGFSVGMWALVDEASGATWENNPVGPNLYGQVWAAPDWLNTSGSPATGRVYWSKNSEGGGDMGTGTYPYDSGSPGCWQSFCDRATSEIHLITSIGAGPCPGTNCTLTFDDPLTIAFRKSGSTTFTGSISGTTLTTTGDSCVTTVAQIVSDATDKIKDGTYVTAVNSCSGGSGSYTVSQSQTVSSETMYGGAHQAHVYYPAHQNGSSMPFISYVGIENLTINHAEATGITFQFCAYCWTRNVEVVNWYSGGINLNYSVRDQIDTTLVNNCGNSVNSGGEYPIGVENASTEIYIVNSITRLCGKGMVGKTGAGSVVAYDYMDDTMYDSYSGIGDYWVDMGVNASHYAGTHHFLFEGNWGDNLDADDTHGNAMYHTYFRNWSTALRSSFTDPSIPATVNDALGMAYACGTTGPIGCAPNGPAPLRAAGPMQHNYWFAYVGNVLGTSGQTTTANGWTYSGNFSTNNHIWMPGWNSDASNPTRSDPNLTLSSGGFLFHHGNYDYVDESIVDWQSGYSQTLPNSFYLGAAPAFFSAGKCTYPWPWVTSDGSTPIQTNSCGGSGLPAKARWDAGTPFVQP
jgi:hypothetical protein